MCQKWARFPSYCLRISPHFWQADIQDSVGNLTSYQSVKGGDGPGGMLPSRRFHILPFRERLMLEAIAIRWWRAIATAWGGLCLGESSLTVSLWVHHVTPSRGYVQPLAVWIFTNPILPTGCANGNGRWYDINPRPYKLLTWNPPLALILLRWTRLPNEFHVCIICFFAAKVNIILGLESNDPDIIRIFTYELPTIFRQSEKPVDHNLSVWTLLS